MVNVLDDVLLVDFVYENVSPTCTLCGLLGHEKRDCRSNKENSDELRGHSKSRKPGQVYRVGTKELQLSVNGTISNPVIQEAEHANQDPIDVEGKKNQTTVNVVVENNGEVIQEHMLGCNTVHFKPASQVEPIIISVSADFSKEVEFAPDIMGKNNIPETTIEVADMKVLI
ncbi:hypothetical protein LWI28_023719 [Acer negundo]|uniref:Zinc knuckle CX2CX4HX4C domain-containing protein n=1 Tax=Acer negundo TaxID=4023 RepID=A0AAD5IK49_ACENE|nr:hypothetical protein LWI28_023719 [Acer negundo]